MYQLLFLVILGVSSLISVTVDSYGIKAKYPSNRLLDFNWPEPSFNIKKFPHEKYCNYYYNRESEDLFTIQKCPNGESFDYHVHECKVKEFSKCWSHRYGKHEIHHHIHSKWRKNFMCPFAEGKFPDIFDCAKFIVCNDGVPAHKHCTPDKLFDKDERHCVNKDNAICASVIDRDDIEHKCPRPTGNFGHPHDCSKYFECHFNEPTLKTCAKDTLFDEVYRGCKAKEEVFCGYRYDPHQEYKSSTIMAKTDASSTMSKMDTTKTLSPTTKIENPTSTLRDTVTQSSKISTDNPTSTTKSNINESSTISTIEKNETASTNHETIKHSKAP